MYIMKINMLHTLNDVHRLIYMVLKIQILNQSPQKILYLQLEVFYILSSFNFNVTCLELCYKIPICMRKIHYIVVERAESTRL